MRPADSVRPQAPGVVRRLASRVLRTLEEAALFRCRLALYQVKGYAQPRAHSAIERGGNVRTAWPRHQSVVPFRQRIVAAEPYQGCSPPPFRPADHRVGGTAPSPFDVRHREHEEPAPPAGSCMRATSTIFLLSTPRCWPCARRTSRRAPRIRHPVAGPEDYKHVASIPRSSAPFAAQAPHRTQVELAPRDRQQRRCDSEGQREGQQLRMAGLVRWNAM